MAKSRHPDYENDTVIEDTDSDDDSSFDFSEMAPVSPTAPLLPSRFESMKLNRLVLSESFEPPLSDSQLYHAVVALDEYRYVDKLSELEPGRWLRWYRTAALTTRPPRTDGGLAAGGFLTKVEIGDKGAYLTMKTGARFFNLAWDNCLVFMKSSPEELAIMRFLDRMDDRQGERIGAAGAAGADADEWDDDKENAGEWV